MFIRSFNKIDIEISKLVGLETYKALYYYYPDLYSYISDPLVPTKYYVNLLANTVNNSGYNFEEAGVNIRKNLVMIVENETPENLEIVQPLLDSSYKINNLKATDSETFFVVFIVVLLGFWTIWYCYKIGFWNHLFGNEGISCYECPSIFDRVRFLD